MQRRMVLLFCQNPEKLAPAAAYRVTGIGLIAPYHIVEHQSEIQADYEHSQHIQSYGKQDFPAKPCRRQVAIPVPLYRHFHFPRTIQPLRRGNQPCGHGLEENVLQREHGRPLHLFQNRNAFIAHGHHDNAGEQYRQQGIDHIPPHRLQRCQVFFFFVQFPNQYRYDGHHQPENQSLHLPVCSPSSATVNQTALKFTLHGPVHKKDDCCSHPFCESFNSQGS